MNAPLSSPALAGSQAGQRSYFSSTSTSSSTASMNSQGGGPTSAPQAPSKQAQPAPVQPPIDPTTPFRRDFNLVAEAAKRAQIAVLMRDFESVGLSG